MNLSDLLKRIRIDSEAIVLLLSLYYQMSLTNCHIISTATSYDINQSKSLIYMSAVFLVKFYQILERMNKKDIYP